MARSSVAVIDYGMGNLHSVAKALEHAEPNIRVDITSDKQRIAQADRVFFPGVGAIGDCMQHLQDRELVDTVIDASRNKPFLGICLGMQALLNHSEENGGTECLGLFAGEVKAFPAEEMRQAGLKVPHMGWNRVNFEQPHPLWQGIKSGSRFYFVHSYYVDATHPDDISATSDYNQTFTSVLARDNVFAVQFHPEKSHKDGLTLLHNFLNWNGES